MSKIGEMIKNVFLSKDKQKENDFQITAEECWISRADIICAYTDMNDEEIVQCFQKSNEKFLLICDENLDNIKGYINIFEYIKYNSIHLTPIHKPEFISIHSEIESFYKHIINEEKPCVVVDEFGDTKGIITPKSIIQGINNLNEQVQFASNNELIVDGKISIKYFAKIVKINIDLNNYDSKSLSGFIMEYLGESPEVDFDFNIGNVNFKILETNGRYIDTIKITIIH